MPAIDAFRMKMILLEDLETNNYETFLSGFRKSVTAASHSSRIASEPEFRREHMHRHLRAAEAYYATPEMIQLALAASEAFPDDETVVPEDLPSPAGFLWLPVPLAVLDIRAKLLRFSAVQWSTYGGKVHLWFYVDRNDMLDSGNQRLAAQGFRTPLTLSLGHQMHLTFEKPLPVSLRFSGDAIVPWDADVNVEYGENEVTMTLPQGLSAADLQPRIGPEPSAQFLLAFWRLCQQTLAERWRETDVPKHLRRKAQRRNIPAEVTVIALRRQAPSLATHRDVEWSHRWLRRGHWRRVWCGPMDGDRYQRAVYIHPTVCGPPDKPLLIRDHVYSLQR